MRRLPAILVVASLGLWLPGCSLFKKNTNGGGSAGGDSLPNPTPPPKFPTADSKADPLNGQSRGPGGQGILAGRVLDVNNVRPPAGTSILVVSADAKDDSSGQELSVHPDGHFTIENLKSGGQYKLIARGKQGDRAVAGIHYATAPNIRVMIRVKDELVSSTTPAVQGPFGSLKDDKRFEPLAPRQTKDAPTKDAWQPTAGTDVTGGEASLPPVQVSVRPSDGVAPSDGFTQSGAFIRPPTLEMPPKASVPGVLTIPPRDLPSRAMDPLANDLAGVPSCVLVGQQLVNFALNDINGERWELKANRKGKLVLLDFWGTWCPPCVKTIPSLVGLEAKYGNKGLEVIGIAYERGGTPQEQAYRVNDVCKKLVVNYRQLLGSSDARDVGHQLGVQAYPFLVLLDDQGNIIWHWDRALDERKREELERLIRSRL